jgi:hypothetical protein
MLLTDNVRRRAKTPIPTMPSGFYKSFQNESMKKVSQKNQRLK